MFARAVYQSILVDPADTRGVRPQGGFGGGGKPTLHLTQVLQHPRTGPIEVCAVLEQDVHVAIPEEGVAADRLRAGDRQHGRRQWVGDLILDDLRGLPWVWRADDDLNVGKVRQRINSGVFDRPDTPGDRKQSG
jgi:hypothetical protein